MQERLYQKGTSYITAWDGKPKGVSMATSKALFNAHMEVIETSTKERKQEEDQKYDNMQPYCQCFW